MAAEALRRCGSNGPLEWRVFEVRSGLALLRLSWLLTTYLIESRHPVAQYVQTKSDTITDSGRRRNNFICSLIKPVNFALNQFVFHGTLLIESLALKSGECDFTTSNLWRILSSPDPTPASKITGSWMRKGRRKPWTAG